MNNEIQKIPEAGTGDVEWHARIEPVSLRSGQPFRVTLDGPKQFANAAVAILIASADAFETDWRSTLPCELDAAAHCAVPHPGLEVDAETAIWVTAVEVDGVRALLPLVSFAIIEAPLHVNDENICDRYQSIVAKQKRRFELELGDPDAEGAQQHRVVYGIENVLVSRELRLPGSIVRPLVERPDGESERRMMDHAIEITGAPSRTPDDAWAKNYGAQRPWISVSFPAVWAADAEAANRLSDVELEYIMSALALTRGDKGRIVAVMIETRVGDAVGASRFRLGGSVYRGNLATGAIAGEGQRALLHLHDGLKQDPVLKLCADLYGQAVQEADVDAQWYRLWNAIEVLAINRVNDGKRARLLDGNYWPNGATTSQAAPRVYELLSSLFRGRQVDERSFVQPADSLFDFVAAWYARRNATVHYGQFDPLAAGQKLQGWHPAALKTRGGDSAREFQWLSTARRLCSGLLQSEATKSAAKPK